ncbi:hypothetical protein T261_5118 [Streptomyces lydicus]|nr:hypothetical protein T261_5118 [Streptomyces lydicus]
MDSSAASPGAAARRPVRRGTGRLGVGLTDAAVSSFKIKILQIKDQDRR